MLPILGAGRGVPTITGGGGALETTADLRLSAAEASTLFETITGTTAVTADNQAVGTWLDANGNGFDLVGLANDTTRPVLRTNAGKPYISFDGTNDVLVRLASLGMYDSASGVTVCVALHASAPASGSAVLVSEGNSADNDSRYIPICAVTGAPLHRASSRVTTDAAVDMISNASSRADSALDSTPRTLIFTDNLTEHAMYLDGSLSAQSPDAYTRSGTLTLNRFALGAQSRATPNNFLPCDIHEIVIYLRVLDAGEIAAEHTRLAALL
jgi:hypothetical protein